jgi:hypothetical protein
VHEWNLRKFQSRSLLSCTRLPAGLGVHLIAYGTTAFLPFKSNGKFVYQPL